MKYQKATSKAIHQRKHTSVCQQSARRDSFPRTQLSPHKLLCELLLCHAKASLLELFDIRHAYILIFDGYVPEWKSRRWKIISTHFERNGE